MAPRTGLDAHGASTDGRESKNSAIVAVLALGGIVVALMQTLIIPIIPDLPDLVGASAGDTAWAITATLLAAAVATPVMGRLGDMYGKRRLLLVSLVVLVVGSLLAAFASTLVPLVIGRALQGFASGVIPLGMSLMRDIMPPKKLAGGVAVISASLGVGGALGMPLAAFIAQYANWHMLFWVSAGLGVLAFVLTVMVVPESDLRASGSFDYAGAAALSATLVTLLLAISKGADWGWGSGLTVGLFVAAAVLAVAWVLWELRATRPLVDVRVAAGKQVLMTNTASAVFGFAMFAQSLVVPQIIQIPEFTGYGLGQSVLVAGLAMAPGGLLMMAMAPVSSRITMSVGPKYTLVTGAVVVGLGYLMGVFWMNSVWQVVVISGIISAGIGLAYAAMPALIMGAVPVEETGAANSFNTLMRSLGTSFASAVAGVVVASVTMEVGGAVLPSGSAFQIVMGAAAGASLVALVIAALLPKYRPAGGDEEVVEVEAVESAAGIAGEAADAGGFAGSRA
ncbi:MFS transporter [Tomitella fengzijianii]|uniref:MFS transporter n=1 Tax=Tomitella fengzijianii TaxID=2597660 RepID=A0A516WZ26_9ACTN|nr:MFS transporter [Tomitella fengzijianii]QDQ96055.1 MFS transporter [Tomitella fengzijianii]